MEWVLVASVAGVIGVVAAIAQRKGWIDLSNRGFRERTMRGGAPLGGFDEVFAPTRYETQLEQDRQAVLPVPAPVPGDRPGDELESGRMRIHLDAQR